MSNCISSSNHMQRNRLSVPGKLKSQIIDILTKYPDGISYNALVLDYNKTFSKRIDLNWLSRNPSERFKNLVLAAPEFDLRIIDNTEKIILSERFKQIISGIPHLNAVKNAPPLQSIVLLPKSDESQEKALISKSSKDNLEKVLQHYPMGIMAVHFPVLYENLTGEQFDIHRYGYNSLLEMTDDLPDIFVRVPAPQSSENWILFHVDNAPDTVYCSSFASKSSSGINSKNRISYSLKETSESSSVSSPLPLPVCSETHVKQLIGKGTQDCCCKAVFLGNIVTRRPKKCLKRVISSDGYAVHILMLENKAYVSIGDISNLFKDNYSVMLLFRLEFHNVTIPTSVISRNDFPDLFEQCASFSVEDFDEKRNAVTVCPLQFVPKIINVLGHPSEHLRNMLIREIAYFNPENVEWSERFEEPDPFEEFFDNNSSCNKVDRLCLHDLMALELNRQYRREYILKDLLENRSDDLIVELRELNRLQIRVANRIKEVEAICIKYSEYN